MLYFDTSAVLSLYIRRNKTKEIEGFLNKINDPIRYWSFGQVEINAALKQLLRIKAITDYQRQTILMNIQTDINLGRIVIEKNVDVEAIHKLAILIIEKQEFTERSLDTIHVASTLTFGADYFVSCDNRQIEMAKREGLKTAP